MGQPGINGRLSRARIEDEGEGSLAFDADVHRLGDLTGNDADRERHILAPAGLGRRPGTDSGGRRKGEGDLRLDMHDGGRPGPADGHRQDESEHGDPEGHECDDEPGPVVAQRPWPSGEGRAGAWPWPYAPRAPTPPGVAQRGASPSWSGT